MGPTGKVEDVAEHIRKLEYKIERTEKMLGGLNAKQLANMTKMAKETKNTPVELKNQLHREHIRRMNYAPGSSKIAAKIVYGD